MITYKRAFFQLRQQIKTLMQTMPHNGIGSSCAVKFFLFLIIVIIIIVVVVFRGLYVVVSFDIDRKLWRQRA